MEASSIKVATRPSLILPDRQETLLIPLGDIQLDPRRRGQPRRAHIGRLRQVVEWGTEHGAYFIGMGDYVDAMSPSNRDSVKAAKMYDSVRDALEEQAEETQEELHELLAPTVGRWLGLVSGHHFWPYEDGSTTDTRLAEYLGCPYLGDTGYVYCRMEPLYQHHRAPTFKVWAWHGQGGGATIASPMNKLEKKIADFEADVYLMGHYHRALAVKKPRLDIIGGDRGSTPEVVHRDRMLVVTGSFMRGYLQGSLAEGRAGGSYVEKAGLPPASLGNIVVMCRPRLAGGYVDVDFDSMSL